MPWNRTNPEKERMAFVVEHQQHTQTMMALCRAYGVSRKTGYRWVNRVAAEGPAGCRDRSRAPKQHPRAVPKRIRQAMVETRLAHPTWGPRKILAFRRQQEPGSQWPAASTIGAILTQEGLTHPRRRRRAGSPYGQPFQACLGPNDVWCADFKGWFRTGDGVRCDPLTITDAYSRMLLSGVALLAPTYAMVRPVFEAAFRQYGLPLAIRTDNGPPFASLAAGGLSQLSVWWLKLGIQPERIDPGHPEQNGRHERMHRTLKAETASPPARDCGEQQARFDAFQEEYNRVRPHEALGQRPPATLYIPSSRPYPASLLEFTYPHADLVRRVRSSGDIKWRQHSIFLSEVLGGESVGLYHRLEGTWEVRFGPIVLGYIQEHDHAPRLRRPALPRPDGSPSGLTRNQEKCYLCRRSNVLPM